MVGNHLFLDPVHATASYHHAFSECPAEATFAHKPCACQFSRVLAQWYFAILAVVWGRIRNFPPVWSASSPGTNRTRRSVRILAESHSKLYRPHKFQDASVFASQDMSVEWNTWIQHRRKDPPTLEELQQNIQRSQMIAENAQQLYQKDAEMRQREIAEGLITTTQVSHASQSRFGRGGVPGGEATSSGTEYRPASWQPSPADAGEVQEQPSKGDKPTGTSTDAHQKSSKT